MSFPALELLSAHHLLYYVYAEVCGESGYPGGGSRKKRIFLFDTKYLVLKTGQYPFTLLLRYLHTMPVSIFED